MVKDKVTITDADSLDMYEFACSHTDIKYPETIGALRLRLVKAVPKDQKACVRCFNSCVWNSDWKNAQQVTSHCPSKVDFVNVSSRLQRH